MKILRIMALDIKLLLKDRTFYVKLLVFPLLLIAILGTVFQNNSGAKIAAFTIAYYNEDTPAIALGNTSLGKLFETQVLKSQSLQDTVRVTEVSSKAQAETLLKTGKAAVYLHIPSGFTQKWLDGHAVTMEQDTSGAQSIQTELMAQLENGFIHVVNTRQAVEQAVGTAAQNAHASPEALSKALEQSDIANASVPEQSSQKGKHSITVIQYYAVGMMLMFSILTAFLLIHGVVEEKQNGIYMRLTSTPLQNGQYISGKLFGVALSVIMQMCILIAFTSFVYRVDWGPIGPVLFISALYGFTVGAFILLLGLTAKNHTSVSSYSSLILYGLSFLGGSFVSTDAFPESMQKIHSMIPNGAALDAYLAVANGKSIGDIGGNLLCIAVYAVGFLLLCFIKLNKKGGVSIATAHIAANAA